MKRKHIGAFHINDSYRRRKRRTPASNQLETTTQRKSGSHVWKRDLQENGPSCHDQLLQIYISKVIKHMIKLYQTIKEWCGHTRNWGMPPQILTAETSVKSPKLVELKKAIGLSEIPSTFELRGWSSLDMKQPFSAENSLRSPRFLGRLAEQRKPCPYEATLEMWPSHIILMMAMQS